MRWQTSEGDRYLRANGKWAKIGKRADGRYCLARGWEGQVSAKPFGLTVNIKRLRDARHYGESWITDK